MKFRKLKGLMTEKGYSQNKLANRLGISVQSLNAKLNERNKFTLREVVKIVEVLEIENIRPYFF